MIRLGLGTGRCGTNSLSEMISSGGVDCQHERFVYGDTARRFGMFFPRPQGEDKTLVLEEIKKSVAKTGEYSDVALYLVSYIPWILEEFAETKVVVLERDREEVVASYMKKTQGKDHWSREPDRILYRQDLWDLCYPKFDAPTKERNIGLYWDWYKETTDNLVTSDSRVIKVATSDLSNYETYCKIMDHYRLPTKSLEDFESFHTNRGT